MNRIFLTAVLIFLFCINFSYGQASPNKRGDIRIMFYNTENFFDTIDDPLTNDNEFLPGSAMKWNYGKYYKKVQSIYQVIAAVGEERPPEIIGFAEIENRKVLNDLIYKTPLEKYPYKIIHQESPDQRGIDVGLIYRSDIVKCLGSDFISIHFPGNENKKTRDILYFKALVNNDTLHVFVNHWPSRLGGKKKSDSGRLWVAGVLKHKTDSLFKINPEAHIIITGDFNDEPQDKSLSSALGAANSSNQTSSTKLTNLSWNLKNNCKCGTYRFTNDWEMLDQFIVSSQLLNNSAFSISLNIGKFDFLLKDDTKYGGYKPFRTYQGPSYKGGFSDHLPVYLDIYYLKKK